MLKNLKKNTCKIKPQAPKIGVCGLFFFNILKKCVKMC